jgi:anti-anti-sigma factor
MERQVGSVTILSVSGRLFLGAASEELDAKLQSLLAEGRVNLLLDCSDVTAIDSQGIKSLIRGVISAQKRGGQLKIMKSSHRLREVLIITHLLTVIETYDGEDAALASFSSPGSAST